MKQEWTTTGCQE